jgi:diguanylate cyclase (GGDEF)-like protein/PAS domain S-box-containing protein
MAIDDGTHFQFLAENSVDIVCRAGIDRVLHYISPSSFNILGWKPEEMVGSPVDEFIFAEDLPVLMATIAQNIASCAEEGTATIRMRKKDGSLVWMENRARLKRHPDTGKLIEFVVTMRDISDRKAMEDMLSTQALTDGLTGLANRRSFDESLEREWKRTLREGSQISLLLLDIDHFKGFNDRYGHQAGDDCLRAVAAAVTASVRATDVVARYGGEEIAVILPSTEIAGAVEVAEKVRLSIGLLRFPVGENLESERWLTASVGAATALARHGGTMKMPESLLLAADNALYKAKHEGRNRVATALLVAARDG